MQAVLDNFAKAVRTRSDHRQTAGERFQTGVGKWIVNRRQNKDVCSGVNTQHVRNFTKKLHRLFAPKAQALRLVEPCISTTRNQQPHLEVPAKRPCLDSKKQSFSFPPGARKQQRGLVWL